MPEQHQGLDERTNRQQEGTHLSDHRVDWRQTGIVLCGEEPPNGVYVSYGVIDETTVSLGARALYVLLQTCPDSDGVEAVLSNEESARGVGREEVAVYLQELFSAGWLSTPADLEAQNACVEHATRRQFGRIPISLLRASVSDRSKVLYAVIDIAASDRDYTSVSRRGFADALSCSLATVDRGIRELRDTGWLVVERIANPATGAYVSSRYFPQSQSAIESVSE